MSPGAYFGNFTVWQSRTPPRVSGRIGQRADLKDPPALLSLLASVNSLVSHCEKTSVVMQRPSPPSSPSVSSLADDEETDHEECGYDFEFIDHLIDEHKCPVCLYALKKRRSDDMRPSLLPEMLVKHLQVLYPISRRFSIIWLSKCRSFWYIVAWYKSIQSRYK